MEEGPMRRLTGRAWQGKGAMPRGGDVSLRDERGDGTGRRRPAPRDLVVLVEGSRETVELPRRA